MITKPKINDKVVQEWKEDLESIQAKEVVKIVSGEVFCDLFRELKEDFRLAASEYGVEFKMIAGPIITIEDDTQSNAVFELADEGIVELWMSPFRQLNHFRTFDYKFVYSEDYHESLAEDRTGSRSLDLLTISKYNYDFDNLISALKMPKYNNPGCFIKKTKAELIQIKNNFGDLYDFITVDELREGTAMLGLRE